MKIEIRPKPKPKEQPVERLGVSIDEAAEMLSVSTRTIRELTASGKLACKKIGRRVIYSVDALKAFLNNE